MFCENCGTQMKDDARFCPICGAKTEASVSKPAIEEQQDYGETTVLSDINPNTTPVYSNFSPPPQNTNQYYPQQMNVGVKVKKKMNKTTQIIICVIVVLVVGVAAYFSLFGGNVANTPQKAIEIFYNAFAKGNVDKLLSVLSPYAKNEIMDNKTKIPSTNSEVKARIPLIPRMITISSIKCTNLEYLTGSEFEKFIDDYKDESYSNNSTHNISSVVRVNVSIEAKLDDETNIGDVKISCCKIGNKWFILSLNQILRGDYNVL
ncbi:MAG: zinc ribbon domain-containing protein [Clostridia bacterium]